MRSWFRSCIFLVIGLTLFVLFSGCMTSFLAERPIEPDDAIRQDYMKDCSALAWKTPLDSEEVLEVRSISTDEALCITGEITWKTTAAWWFGVKEHYLTLLDVGSGEVKWKKPIEKKTYTGVFTTDSSILVQYDSDICCYARDGGTLLWEQASDGINSQYSYAPWVGVGIKAWRDKKGLVVTGFDLENGSEMWRADIEESLDAEKPLKLHQKNSSVLIVSESLIEIALSDGEILLRNDFQFGDPSLIRLNVGEDKILVCENGILHSIDPNSGKFRWTVLPEGSELLDFTCDDNRVAAVYADSGSLTLKVLDSVNGSLISRSTIDGEYTGPCLLRRGKIFLTTSERLLSFDPSSGEKVHDIELPDYLQQPVDLPDNLLVLNDLLIVARERGIAAFHAGDGHALYSHYIAGSERYTYSYLSHKLRLMQTMLATREGGSENAAAIYQDLASAGDSIDNVWMDYYQKQADYHYDAWQLSQGEWDESINRDLYINAARNNYEMQKFHAKLEAMEKTGDAIVGGILAAGQIAKAMFEEAEAEMLEMRQRQVEHSIQTHQASIQQNYYIRPFYTDRRGLCIVDITTGKRAEITLTPYSDALPVNIPDFPVFELSRSTDTLITRARRDDPETRYSTVLALTPHTNVIMFNWLIPCPSLTSYKLDSLQFSGPLFQDEAYTSPPDLSPEEERFMDAVIAGSLDEVKEMVEGGVDVNIVDEYRVIPLMYAVAGSHEELIEYLLNQGADYTWTDYEWWYPVQYANVTSARARLQVDTPLWNHLKEEGRLTTMKDYK